MLYKPAIVLKGEEVIGYQVSTIFSRHEYEHPVMNTKLTVTHKNEMQCRQKSHLML